MGYMKIMAGRYVVPVLALWVMVATPFSCLGGPEKGKTNAPVKTTADKAKDTVKDTVAEGKDAIRQGVDKADKVLTNVVHQIGVGVYKATGAVTNAVGEVTEAVKSVTRSGGNGNVGTKPKAGASVDFLDAICGRRG